jgi:nucleoside-diphosphate-sugar epimerase
MQAGLVGGWIVLHLIHRGEDPRYIRVLDLRAPSRSDLTTGPASLVDFVPCDISDAADTRRGFLKAWPDDTAPLTVFHTAANIRFYERHSALLPRSAKVNVIGTQNVLDAAQLAGASVLVYTSSASVGVRSTRFLLWPWEMQPKHSVQMLFDDDPVEEMKHYDHFSNYAVTKLHAEQLVRQADRSVTNGVTLRTGVIRPGNGE